MGDIKREEFCALNLIDIDGFDDINELYGFSVGNEIIIEVMQRLKDFSEGSQTKLYRLETGNFAIIDANMDRFASYDKFLEKIQDLFKKEISIKSLELEIFIYVTVGASIAQSDPLKRA